MERSRARKTPTPSIGAINTRPVVHDSEQRENAGNQIIGLHTVERVKFPVFLRVAWQPNDDAHFTQNPIGGWQVGVVGVLLVKCGSVSH
jgi:hypothetical protein